jgi:formate hydrogenlyase subunit 3/multisubunit Na+/H+ antiporter MnhD subunit
MIPESLQSILMVATLAVPLIVALILPAAHKRSWILAGTPIAALPAILLVFLGQTDVNVSLPWTPEHTFLQLDSVGRIFLGFTAVLWLAAGWYSRSYLKNDPNPVRFNLFFLLSMAGNFSLILAGNVPAFYVGFAVMGLASAGLVLHRGDAEATRAGKIYLVLAMFGEVLILSGFAFLTVKGGTTDIATLHQQAISPASILLLLVGFGIKAGSLALHFWLPLAHPAAPVPASAVLSGAMIKAGLIGWIRFLPLGEASVPWLGFTLITAGLGAAFLGTFVGVFQRNPKTVLAYSSISQMGIITTGLGIGAIRPEAWFEIQTSILLYATHHALAKGSLFLGVAPAHMVNSRVQLYLVRIGLILPALALAGAPFTSGALAKVALKSNLEFLPGSWAILLGILLPVAAVGTTLKMVRFLWLVWPRKLFDKESFPQGIWIPWVSLVVATMIGIWILPGALGFLPVKLSPEKLWLSTWPLLVGGGIAALGAWFRHKLIIDPSRWLPPGDIGVLLEGWLERFSRLIKIGPYEFDGPNKQTKKTSFIWVENLPKLILILSKIENNLRNWSVAGVGILTLIVIILIFLI